MSAVTVIYNLNERPVTHDEMGLMLDRLEHRGGDDRGVWIDNQIGLGHRMRWTTPESLHEKLPLKSAASSSVITCDARIDNRDELLVQLSFSNRPVEEIADSEIVLAAYEKWGEGCIERFIGDFIFVIWDARKQKLLCARDSMGVKHFYYYYKPGHLFAIASEIKALLCHPDIPKELNETNIGDVLILNYQDKENTPYKNIKRLPANNALAVDRDGLKIWQYWFSKSNPKFGFRSSKDYEEEFREIFTEAVTCRLRSAYPVGSLLSGGLDSSSISCVASRYLKENNRDRLETFSAIFPEIAKIDSRIDERHYIDLVIKQIDCHPNFVEADAFSPLEDMEKLHWHADHPIGAPNIFMDWALFKAAKSRNVRVILSGFDGDSTVSYGYEGLFMMARQGRWLRMVKDAAALSKNMPSRHHNMKKLVWKQGFREAPPESVRQLLRVMRGKPRKQTKVNNLPSILNYNYKSTNSAFADEQDLKNRYFQLIERNQPEGKSYAESWWNCLCNGLFAHALETFEKSAAAFEVNVGFPFFDRRLIEFCMALPAGQKLYRGWTRSIIRRAMNGILPPEVQWRTDKANIGLSFKVNMLKYGRGDVEEALFESSDVLEQYIDLESLHDAYERYKDDPLKYEGEPMFILSSVYLSNWLRQSFGGKAGI